MCRILEFNINYAKLMVIKNCHVTNCSLLKKMTIKIHQKCQLNILGFRTPFLHKC